MRKAWLETDDRTGMTDVQLSILGGGNRLVLHDHPVAPKEDAGRECGRRATFPHRAAFGAETAQNDTTSRSSHAMCLPSMSPFQLASLVLEADGKSRPDL